MKRTNSGFSLTELMIVMAVIAILAAVTVPAFQDSGYKARRSDGMAALEKAAARQEQYYFQFNAYTNSVNPLGGTSGTLTSQEGYYTISVSQTTTQDYTLTATATGTQAGDTDCTSLSLNNLGQKTSTGSASANVCWKKQ